MQVLRRSLISGLSYALDIAGKNNLSHSKSTAYISEAVGKELGIVNGEAASLYYAALLHDIGISNEYILFDHCRIGYDMLKKLPLPGGIPECVLYHHELYDGSGPFGLKGGEIPLNAGIICFASAFDDMFGAQADLFNRDLFLKIIEWIESNTDIFNGDVINAFQKLIKRESFLLDYFNREMKFSLSEKSPSNDEIYFAYGDILKFAECIAEIIDHRSPFTYAHSKGIAELALKTAESLGHDRETQEKMHIAGLLHDIGKLNVSIDILHKEGKLTPEERFEINKHTYYTRKVLEQIQGFEDIVDYASNHHERMDGTGYPYRIPGEKLGELERVMAVCDVYQALTEERPYRESLPAEKVWAIMDGMVSGGHLDGEMLEKFKKIM